MTVEHHHQPWHRHLSLMVLHQQGAAQLWAEMTVDPFRQRRLHDLTVGRYLPKPGATCHPRSRGGTYRWAPPAAPGRPSLSSSGAPTGAADIMYSAATNRIGVKRINGFIRSGVQRGKCELSVGRFLDHRTNQLKCFRVHRRCSRRFLASLPQVAKHLCDLGSVPVASCNASQVRIVRPLRIWRISMMCSLGAKPNM